MNLGLELITKGKSITQIDLQRLAVVIRSEIPIELQKLLLLHNGGDLEVNSFYRLIGNTTFQTSSVESILSVEEIETTFNNLSDDSTLCESKVIPFASLLELAGMFIIEEKPIFMIGITD
ncbi:hypothetical protein QNI19_06705 [Cytophagaceae bacterium DM2B3-1]|uniref:Uncharacterized protein n=1 Tax=Xanthocytophaga flava TaxID=3048013 RepID=A0ABT7CFU7_9BACT|nr:hypothetical protein [Xanthocytophaga flavus]MDJ1492615.1 hypothetical protein [Xanthocytophaga flavus]